MKHKIIGILVTVVFALSSNSFAQAPQNAAVSSDQGMGTYLQVRGMGQSRGKGNCNGCRKGSRKGNRKGSRNCNGSRKGSRNCNGSRKGSRNCNGSRKGSRNGKGSRNCNQSQRQFQGKQQYNRKGQPLANAI